MERRGGVGGRQHIPKGKEPINEGKPNVTQPDISKAAQKPQPKAKTKAKIKKGVVLTAKQLTSRSPEKAAKLSARLLEAFKYYSKNQNDFPGETIQSMEELSSLPEPKQHSFLNKVEAKRLNLAYVEYYRLYQGDPQDLFEFSEIASFSLEAKHDFIIMIEGQIETERKHLEELKTAFDYYQSLTYNVSGKKLTLEEIKDASVEEQNSFLHEVEDLRLKDAFEKYRNLKKLSSDSQVKNWKTVEELLAASSTERLDFIHEVEDLELQDAWSKFLSFISPDEDLKIYEEFSKNNKRLFIGVVDAAERARNAQAQSWSERAWNYFSGIAALSPKTFIETNLEKLFGRTFSFEDVKGFIKESAEFTVLLSPEKQMEFLEKKQASGEWQILSSVAILSKGIKDRVVEIYEQGKTDFVETFGPSAMTQFLFEYMIANPLRAAKEKIGQNITNAMGILDVPIKLIGDRVLGRIQSIDVAKEGYFLTKSILTTEDYFTQEQLDSLEAEAEKFSADHKGINDYIMSLKVSDRMISNLTYAMGKELMGVSTAVLWSQVKNLAPSELIGYWESGGKVLAALLKGQTHILLMESGLFGYLQQLLPMIGEEIPLPGVPLTPKQIAIGVFFMISTVKMLEKIYFTRKPLTEEEINEESYQIAKQTGIKLLMGAGGPLSLKELGVSSAAKLCSKEFFQQICSLDPLFACAIFVPTIVKKTMKGPVKRIIKGSLETVSDVGKATLTTNQTPTKPGDQTPSSQLSK